MTPLLNHIVEPQSASATPCCGLHARSAPDAADPGCARSARMAARPMCPSGEAATVLTEWRKMLAGLMARDIALL